jgi:hypothetical protein
VEVEGVSGSAQTQQEREEPLPLPLPDMGSSPQPEAEMQEPLQEALGQTQGPLRLLQRLLQS